MAHFAVRFERKRAEYIDPFNSMDAARDNAVRFKPALVNNLNGDGEKVNILPMRTDSNGYIINIDVDADVGSDLYKNIDKKITEAAHSANGNVIERR